MAQPPQGEQPTGPTVPGPPVDPFYPPMEAYYPAAPAAGSGIPPLTDPVYQPGVAQPLYQPAYQPDPATTGYAGYPGYRPPRRRGRMIALMVLSVALLVAVSGAIIAVLLVRHTGTPLAKRSGALPGSSASAPSGTASAADGGTHAGDLRGYLVPAPTGSKPWRQPLGTGEALSLDQAADLSSDAATRAKELRQYRYQQGAVRCWTTAAGTVVNVRLYQFGSPAEAREFFDGDVDATGTGLKPENMSQVSGVPGGVSYADPTKDGDGYLHVISLGLRGDVVLVVSLAQSQPIDVSVPNGILLQQYQKL